MGDVRWKLRQVSEISARGWSVCGVPVVSIAARDDIGARIRDGAACMREADGSGVAVQAVGI